MTSERYGTATLLRPTAGEPASGGCCLWNFRSTHRIGNANLASDRNPKRKRGKLCGKFLAYASGYYLARVQPKVGCPDDP